MLRTLIVALAAAALAPTAALAAHPAKEPPHVEWSFEKPLGTFDRGALQRGYQVYREVCASCHAMKQLHFRNLGEQGGPFEAVTARNHETGASEIVLGAAGEGRKFINPNDNPYVKTIAADYEVEEIDPLTGDTATRKARPSDRFHSPFPNDAAAAAANGGAHPPDMSVLAKARRGGASYIKALITGYAAPPAGLEVPVGKYYNPYMEGDLSGFWKGDPRHVPVGGFIAMPPQLTPDRVTYSDGTKATPEQMASDVATFLAWAADPKAEARKTMGLQVLIYLLILTALVYAAYRAVWKDVKH
ncbi:MAG: cytochrome c1 [Hyphomonadaceae bacterium]